MITVKCDKCEANIPSWVLDIATQSDPTAEIEGIRCPNCTVLPESGVLEHPIILVDNQPFDSINN